MVNALSCTSYELKRVSNGLGFFVSSRRAGESVQAPELFYRAWDECLESQVVDKERWVGSVLSRLAGIDDRFEIGVHNGEHTVGGIILAPDDDVHVGCCMSVFAQYVMPEYRNKGVSMYCMRLALRVARDAGYKVLAYTHRVGVGRYETIYRRIK